MSDVYRTPEDRFEELPDFPWEPRYHEWEGIRLARIDEGDGEPIVLLHGMPSWSFLYRKVIPPLLEAGYRCIAPDLPGFGRSDKPVDIDWYTLHRHVDAVSALLEELDVGGATFVLHDWGGPIGMAVAAAQPERCARIVAMDTGLFTSAAKMSEGRRAFVEFVESTEDLPIGMLMQGGTASELDEAVVAAYDAPFPEAEAKRGARAFPLMLPDDPDDPLVEAGERTAAEITTAARPALVLWADSDPILPLELGEAVARKLGWPEPEVIGDASHFLQEDQGERIGERIAAWLGEQAAAA
jgi:haloalkane dehalogenase